MAGSEPYFTQALEPSASTSVINVHTTSVTENVQLGSRHRTLGAVVSVEIRITDGVRVRRTSCHFSVHPRRRPFGQLLALGRKVPGGLEELRARHPENLVQPIAVVR